MATTTKNTAASVPKVAVKEQVKASINADLKSLLRVMLRKADLTESDIVESSLRSWIATNLDLLSATEREQFKHLFLNS